MGVPERSSGAISGRAILVAISLLAFGLVNVVRIVVWGADPLWGFGILPPILFFTVLGWLAFRTKFGRESDD